MLDAVTELKRSIGSRRISFPEIPSEGESLQSYWNTVFGYIESACVRVAVEMSEDEARTDPAMEDS